MARPSSLVVRSERVVLPDGDARRRRFRSATGGSSAIGDHARRVRRRRDVIDAGELVVLPGLVDTHVHINEPGRADWEGFEHATRAAAAGGVTTLVDMPLNSIPPTTTVEALEAKRARRAGDAHVDVAFWGGVVPGNAGDLEPLARAGVLRLQVLSVSVRRRRVRARRRSGSARRRCRCSPRSACRCSCTPSGRTRCVEPRPAPIRAATRPGSRAGRPPSEQRAIELLIRLAARVRRARPHRPPGVGRRRCRAIRAARARGVRDHASKPVRTT